MADIMSKQMKMETSINQAELYKIENYITKSYYLNGFCFQNDQ